MSTDEPDSESTENDAREASESDNSYTRALHTARAALRAMLNTASEPPPTDADD